MTEVCSITGFKAIRKTDRALLVECPFGDTFWIPTSKLMRGSIRHAGETGSLVISEALAQEKGII